MGVELYRNGDKLTAPLRLSHRPMPEIPATPKELADRVREINKAFAINFSQESTMNENTQTLEFEQIVPAPPAQVFFAFATGTGLREWLSKSAEAHAVKHPPFYLYFADENVVIGSYIEVVKDEKLVMKWRGSEDPAYSQVTVLLSEVEEGTAVRVEHAGLGTDSAWDISLAMLHKLWDEGLENLAEVVRTGFDSREYNRPLLGIWLSDFVSEEHIAKLGVPVDYGHILAGVLPGMGAEIAGLKRDDVLLTLDGIPLRTYDSFAEATRPHKAGDMIAVEYFRDGEIVKTQFQLAHRPKPEVPENALALSEKMDGIYKTANAQLQEVVEEATETQIAYRSAPKEWNTRDVFAHMILTERDTYHWAASLVQGNEGRVYTAHLPARLKTIKKIMSDVPALMQGLKSSQHEGVTFLTELPSEFVARKGSYVRLATELLQGSVHHYQEHIDQIRENLTTAQALN